MVVADSIVQAYINILGGSDVYFSAFALPFVFVVVYFFYKISE
jgi:hypothetical protein